MPVLIHPDVLDISVHNEVRDWSRVAAQGIRGIIHKASQGGGFVDRQWAARAGAIRDAGMLLGSYHFLDASAGALQQARNYLAQVKPFSTDDMLLCADWEEYAPGGRDLTASLATCKEFLRIVFEETGQRPVLYSGSLLKAKGAGDPFLTQHRLWLAQYARTPQLPRGWDSYFLWQFSGDGFGGYGTYDGIATKGIDSNVFGGVDLAAEWAGRIQDRRRPTPIVPAPIVAEDQQSQRRQASADPPQPAPPEVASSGSTGNLADRLSLVNSQASVVNSLADQGSRIAQAIKGFKDSFWSIFGGGAAAAGVLKGTVDPNKGTAAMLHEWLAAHAIWVILASIMVMALIGYWYIKRAERGLMSAYNGGRYDPNKPEQ